MAQGVDPRASGAATTGTLSVTRKVDFSRWYDEVLDKADLAESSCVRGCMIIEPWGYGIWEQVQRQMDDLFKKEKCCDNFYFPLLIPTRLFEAEAAHVEGFAKEMAVVTHSKMKLENGKLVPDPDSKLDEALVIRPTSEVIIGETMRARIHSHRDMPLLINQWANVLRWEHRTKPFLRTMEFLWQEGHCAFATEEQAKANALKMANVYKRFMNQHCALPVILGQKSTLERFAGADATYCLEAMMQDGKAVQAGTSHNLGQHFALASKITFQDKDELIKHAHTTSWGVSTRLIGALIMVHGDDYGMRVPPRLAKYHVVILPSGYESAERKAYIEKIEKTFDGARYAGRDVAVYLDEREVNAGEKGWDWVRKGVPIRLEIGKREAEGDTITVRRRDEDPAQKSVVKAADIVPHVIAALGQIQDNYYAQAQAFMDSHIRSDITTLDQIKAFFANPENTGFVRAKWCGDMYGVLADDAEMKAYIENPKSFDEMKAFIKDPQNREIVRKKLLDGKDVPVSDKESDIFAYMFKMKDKAPLEYSLKEQYKVVIRCLPEDQSGTEGTCVLTGKPATLDAIFGRSY